MSEKYCLQSSNLINLSTLYRDKTQEKKNNNNQLLTILLNPATNNITTCMTDAQHIKLNNKYY